MNNRLQKKNSLLKEIYDAYENIILAVIGIAIAIIGILLIIFVPYWLGRLLHIAPFVGSLLHSLESNNPSAQGDHFGVWLIGIAVIITIFLLIYATIELKYTISMLKKTAYLPTTEEELKSLNINTFDELDAFMLNFFGTKDISSDFIFEHLVSKLIDCFKLLPLPKAVIYLESYKNCKDEYIKLRSRVLAGKIFKQEHRTWCKAAIKDIQDYESTARKKSFAEDPDIALIWMPGEPCPYCGEDPYKSLNANIFKDWQPRYCPNCGIKIKKDVVERG